MLSSRLLQPVINGKKKNNYNDIFKEKNAPLNLVEDEVRETTVVALIDQDLHAWKANFIMDMFERKDVEVICRI